MSPPPSNFFQPQDPTISRSITDLYRWLERLPAGIIVLDVAGVVLAANLAAGRDLGLADEPLEGRDFFRSLVPELEKRGFGGGYRKDEPVDELGSGLELKLQTPAGERFLRITLLRLEGFAPAGALVHVEDRTQLVLEKKRRERAENLASVGELATNLAHEVNNPLAAIKSFAQLLARDAGEEQRHALDLIIEESDRIGRAIENLVAFARQQGASGRELVNLSSLVAGVIEVRRYSLEAAGIEIRMDLDASLSPIMGEPGALQQVVLNLVTRAEHDLALRRSGRILIVRARESSEGVVLYVVDNGPGISRAALPYLFDPAGNAEHNLELATSARIVRDHGGYILAESEPGRGVTFFVRLPRAGAPPISAPSRPVLPAAPPPGRPLRVLVADDEPTLRLAISLFLSRRGHQVTQAADAFEALELARSEDFDVALVDARMPGDGLALLEQLEAMPALAGRTALMTGDLGRARTTQGIPTGRPYLVKPFDMNEAVKLLERLGEGSHD